MDTIVIYAISLGILVGVAVSYLVTKWIVTKMARKPLQDNVIVGRIVIVGGYVGAVLAILPALFLAFVVGGSMGGAYAERLSSLLGLGSIGVPFGLAIGIVVVFVITCGVGACIGALLGRAGGMLFTAN